MLFGWFFSGCGLVHPSLLQWKTRMGGERGKNNLRALFYNFLDNRAKREMAK